MTVVTDSKKRITLRYARPGDRFDVEYRPDGKFVLTKLEPAPQPQPAKVRFEKRGKYTVGVTDRPLNMAAVKELLADFP